MKNSNRTVIPKRVSLPRVASKVIRDTSLDGKLAQEILHRFGPPNPTRPGTKI
jgi:hypothetical protein